MGFGCVRQVASQAAERQASRRQLDERLTRLHFALIVLRQSAVANQPSETLFNDPPARLDTEAARAWPAFDDLQVPAVALLFAPVSQLLAAVRGIGPDLFEPGHEKRQSAQELARADRVMNIGGGDVARDGQAQRVDQEMPLPAFHTFVGVVAADSCRFLNGLHTLAVHDGGTWVWIPAHALPLSSMQGGLEKMPGAFEAERSEMVEHRLPGREVAREVAPGTPGAHHIEDSVEDAVQRVGAGSASC